MLCRYKIFRGRSSPGTVPDGIRQDTRWRCTKHPLHTTKATVDKYLANPDEPAWQEFRGSYLEELEDRFNEDRTPFDGLAKLARTQDVYIGCNCPTNKNPRVDRCHTWLALEFMQQKYPDLKVVFPSTTPQPTGAKP